MAIDSRGYHYRYENGQKVYTHREVALSIPNPDGHRYVRHVDGNPTNNSVDNLEWVPFSELDINHARGESHGSSKLTWGEVEQIRILAESGVTLQHLSERFNVSYGAIWKIVNHVTWCIH